jgi:hypothetical protein
MAYLIIPDEKSDLLVDFLSLKDQLQKRWPEVLFLDTAIPNSTSVLSWKISMTEDVLFGFLHNDRKTISIDSFERGVAMFAVWYRIYIPSQYQLFLYHDSSPEMIALQADHTEEGILNELNRM